MSIATIFCSHFVVKIHSILSKCNEFRIRIHTIGKIWESFPIKQKVWIRLTFQNIIYYFNIRLWLWKRSLVIESHHIKITFRLSCLLCVYCVPVYLNGMVEQRALNTVLANIPIKTVEMLTSPRNVAWDFRE